MNNMKIFEPAMCCSTGLCGVGVDPELLRISTVLDTLRKHGVTVDRFNLSSAPMEFVKDETISSFISSSGPDGLPAVLLDGVLVLSGRYPSNDEFTEWLNLPPGLLGKTTEKQQDNSGCCCKGGCC